MFEKFIQNWKDSRKEWRITQLSENEFVIQKKGPFRWEYYQEKDNYTWMNFNSYVSVYKTKELAEKALLKARNQGINYWYY